MEKPRLEDRAHEEILSLYQVTVDDIEKTKRWIWDVTYHTIVAQGGIYALQSIFGSTSSRIWPAVMFTVLCIGVAVIGSSQARLATESLDKFRKRVDRCMEHFEEPFRQVFFGPSGERAPKSTIPAQAIITVTTALVVALLWFQTLTPKAP